MRHYPDYENLRLRCRQHPDPAVIAAMTDMQTDRAQLVELVLFAGMSISDAARQLYVSPRTAYRWQREFLQKVGTVTTD